MRRRDLTGLKFTKLQVMSVSGKDRHGHFLWNCLCDCGNTAIVDGCNLVAGKQRSCGCLAGREDLTGQKFNRLTVISFSHSRGAKSVWNCKCSCGNTSKTESDALKSGRTKSCGCLRTEALKRLSGENSVHWDSNLTDEDRQNIRLEIGYRDWCKAVKSRDDFTCRVCGNKGGKLVSHHLYNYKDYPEKRMELDNGVCLCDNCHRAFHSAYGRRHNTLEQFDLYLKEYEEANVR